MKVGKFEVTLLNHDTRVPYQEHILNGKTIAEVKPGDKYVICVQSDFDDFLDYDNDIWCKVHIDGNCIGYSRRCRMHDNEILQGFRHGETKLKYFTFRLPTVTNNESEIVNYCDDLGCITVDFIEKKKTSECDIIEFFNLKSTNDKINADKKFWKQASTVTQPGEYMNDCLSFCKNKFRDIRTVNIMTLYYHTKQVCDFLKTSEESNEEKKGESSNVKRKERNEEEKKEKNSNDDITVSLPSEKKSRKLIIID